MYCHSRELKILTDHFNLNLHFSQWFGLSRMTAFSNLFLPSAGAVSFKAVYLKKCHNLKYSSFVALTGFAIILKLMIYALFSLVLLLLSRRTEFILFAISGLFFTIPSAFLILKPKISISFLPFTKVSKNIIEDWQKIRSDHKMIRNLILLNCTIFVISSLIIYFSFRVFSINPSVASSGIISVFTSFSGVLKFIPANLGLKESLFVIISNLYGTGVNEGLHAAIFHRIIGTIFTVLLAPGFVLHIFKKPFRKASHQNGED